MARKRRPGKLGCQWIRRVVSEQAPKRQTPWAEVTRGPNAKILCSVKLRLSHLLWNPDFKLTRFLLLSFYCYTCKFWQCLCSHLAALLRSIYFFIIIILNYYDLLINYEPRPWLGLVPTQTDTIVFVVCPCQHDLGCVHVHVKRNCWFLHCTENAS